MKRFAKILLSAALAAGCMLGLTGCNKAPAGNISNSMTFTEGDKIAEITFEDYGTIKAKLYPDMLRTLWKILSSLRRAAITTG